MKNDLNIDITLNDINYAYMIRKKKNKFKSLPPIAVGFTVVKIRTEILQKVKLIRKDKLKTDKDFTRIYYNERFTKTIQELAFSARQLVKKEKIKSTWTFKAEIYIKSGESSSPI